MQSPFTEALSSSNPSQMAARSTSRNAAEKQLADESVLAEKQLAEKQLAEKRKREEHIAILEKYAGKYERAIKRNEKALRKTFVYATTGTTEPPADPDTIWYVDLIQLGRRQQTAETLPRHKENLEKVLEDIRKLNAGLPESEICDLSRATIHSKRNFGICSIQMLLKMAGAGLGY